MEKKIKNLTSFVFAVYIALLIWLILFKLSTNLELIPHIRKINLIPFADSVIVNGKIYLKEIIYNILVFVPLGVYVSIFKDKWSIVKKVLIGLELSLIFEIIQYVFSIGGSDITDLLGNTLGTFLGVNIYVLIKKMFNERAIKIINIIGLAIELLAILLLIILNISN